MKLESLDRLMRLEITGTNGADQTVARFKKDRPKVDVVNGDDMPGVRLVPDDADLLGSDAPNQGK